MGVSIGQNEVWTTLAITFDARMEEKIRQLRSKPDLAMKLVIIKDTDL